jgi:hypothetical protein
MMISDTGRGIFLITLITSSTFALIEGGILPLLFEDPLFSNLGGLYHFLFLLARLFALRVYILFLYRKL